MTQSFNFDGCKIGAAMLVIALTLGITQSAMGQDASGEEASAQWYRGNLHTHSLWSDGNDFPEMITQWYVDNGYQFLALTDHNVLSRGERWMALTTLEQRAGKTAMEKYLATFGEDWVEIRDRQVKPKEPADGETEQELEGETEQESEGEIEQESDGETEQEPEDETEQAPQQEVRLRGLEEFRGKFESPGKFLLIESEEISDRAEGVPIHMNAANLKSLISPLGGKTVTEAINNNLRAAEEQAQKNGEPILVHLNHPNFGWAVTAEQLAEITNEQFFEVYNGHPSINHLGDATRPGIEKMWDIANTLRIGELKAAPMLGLGTDDSHHYHGHPKRDATTGRGWVMVRSSSLEPTAIIEAMKAGDFYSSSGVELKTVDYDSGTKTLKLKIKAQPGIQFTTQFIGTRRNYDKTATAQLSADGKPVRATKIYSKDVGAVLATSDSMEPQFQLTGNELYVRAVVTSSRQHPNPSFKEQKEQAWTQPVGWK